MIFIDSDDYKAAGIEVMFFPGGEPHVKLPVFKGVVIIYFKLRTWNDVGVAACILNALSYNVDAKVHAGIMYFPGARQDKSGCEGKYPLTVELIGKVLHRHTVQQYYVFDPHSAVLSSIWPGTRGIKDFNMVHLDLPIRPDVKGIIAPDSGAAHRARVFKEWFYPNAAFLLCNKVRDAHTGALSQYHMPDITEAGRYIVVDDICDGGGTFNLLAETARKNSSLMRNGGADLELVVSHGIFSKGLSAIHPLYKSITTTDSWCRHDYTANPRLTVLPLANLLKFAVLLGSK